MRILAAGLILWSVFGVAAAQHHNKHDERALEEDPRLADGQLAPVLEGLGEHHRPVSTSSESAQLFFDQGLLLTYGFNHQEALRSFKEAARLDPDCAMAYWGWALVLGPNLNLPMRPEVVDQAWEAIQLAVAGRDGVTEPERGLIDALALRYSDDPEADRPAMNAAYADAMRELHEAYPEDDDVATLYAASLMNLTPWNYWTADGNPKQNTTDVLTTLEAVIARDPHHEGALHYYIHIIESVDPARGEKAADLLRGLAPGAGHLVHMPSHIYMQLGRYAESYDANIEAAQADEDYITQCRAQGIYPLTYYPHNVHFVAWAAMAQGRSADALAASRKVASNVPGDMHDNVWGLYQTFLAQPLFTMTRFGMWDEILVEPSPPDTTLFWQGIWHYACGLAHVHQGNGKKAKKELSAIRKILDGKRVHHEHIGFTDGGKLLAIAREVLSGEMQAAAGKYDTALVHLDRAVRLEDSLLYNEPPDWYYPVRHTLGAVLLEAGRPVEAEVVYWDDLKKNRNNGFALHGLSQALRAQGREDEAAAIEERQRAAWSAADKELRSSRF